MTPTIRCQNCKREFAFGKYRVTKAGYAFWKEDEFGAREKIFVKQQILMMYLCADCGFNMVNMRRATLNEYELERKPPNGKAYTVWQESMVQRPIYEHVVLVEHLFNETERQYARELSMPPRDEYLKQLNHLRATRGVQKEGEPQQQRAVVVLALGGASARRKVEIPGTPPTHNIAPSSATAENTPVATAAVVGRVSPRRRG